MITVIEKTLTPTEVKNGNTTPILLLAAPAAGYVRNIFGIVERLVLNTTDYDGVNATGIGSNPTGIYQWASGDIMADQAETRDEPMIDITTSSLLRATKDPLYWTANGDSTVGDHTYSIIVVYEDKIITVS